MIHIHTEIEQISHKMKLLRISVSDFHKYQMKAVKKQVNQCIRTFNMRCYVMYCNIIDEKLLSVVCITFIKMVK